MGAVLSQALQLVVSCSDGMLTCVFQVIHARWAMLGALGCVTPELLEQTNNVPWFKAGAEIFSDSGIQYLGIDGFINAKSILATLIVQVILMSFVEGYRVNGGPAGTGLDAVYPGEQLIAICRRKCISGVLKPCSDLKYPVAPRTIKQPLVLLC